MRAYVVAVCAVCCVAITAGPAVAADLPSIPREPQAAQTSTSSALPSAESFDMTSSFFRMVGGLLFCVGIFGAGVHVVKRYGNPMARSSKRRITVLERVALTPKTSLVLVSVDGKEILLAAGPDRAQLISAAANQDKDFEASLDRYVLPDEKEQLVCAV